MIPAVYVGAETSGKSAVDLVNALVLLPLDSSTEESAVLPLSAPCTDETGFGVDTPHNF